IIPKEFIEKHRVTLFVVGAAVTGVVAGALLSFVCVSWKASKEKAGLQGKITELETKNEELEKTNSDYRQRLGETTRELKVARQQREETTRQLESARQQQEETTRQLESARQQGEETTRELKVARQGREIAEQRFEQAMREIEESRRER